MKIPFVKPVVSPHVFCLLQDGLTYGFVQRAQPAGISFSQNFPYPPNTLGAGASGTPLFSAAALAPAVDAARRFAQGRLTRASVVFPDSWARILPVEFDSLPGSPDAVREMVLWKLKKLLPGITAELDVVYLEMAKAGEAKRLIVAAASAEMLRSIETSFEERGVRVGALAPASLVLFEGLAPLLASKSPGDYAILHRSSGSIAFLVARGETPILFRYRPMEEEEGHEQELRLSLSYYAEKLNGQGLTAIYVHDQAPEATFRAEILPVPPQVISGRLFGADSTFDERITSRPELLPGFAAVYGR
jgi:hypothetical protein